MEIIEDNAQSFLSRDGKGHELGLRGHIGLFSFRKTLPVIDGGSAIFRKDSKLYGTVLEKIEEINSLPDAERVKKIVVGKIKIRNFLQLMPTVCNILFFHLLRTSRSFRKSSLVEANTDFRTYSSIIFPPIDLEMIRNHKLELFKSLQSICAENQAQVMGIEKMGQGVPASILLNIAPEKVAPLQKKLHSLGLDCVNWPRLHSSADMTNHPFSNRTFIIPFVW